MRVLDHQEVVFYATYILNAHMENPSKMCHTRDYMD